MAIIPALHTWVTNETITASLLNTLGSSIRDNVNDYCADIRAQQTFADVQTFSAIPVFSLGFSVTAGGGTITAGKLTTAATAAVAGAGFNLPHGVVPNSPANGDLWSTTAGFYGYANGAIVGPFSSHTGSGTNGKMARWTGTAALADAGATDNGTYTNNTNNPRMRTLVTGAGLSSGQNILTLLSPTFNVGTMWAVGNPTRLTIPAGAGGAYLVTINGNLIHSSSTASVSWQILKNGGALYTGGSFVISINYANSPFSGVCELAAGDYIEIAITAGDNSCSHAGVQVSCAKLW